MSHILHFLSFFIFYVVAKLSFSTWHRKSLSWMNYLHSFYPRSFVLKRKEKLENQILGGGGEKEEELSL